MLVAVLGVSCELAPDTRWSHSEIEPSDADRIGLTIVCAGGAPESSEMPRLEVSTSYLKSHDDPLGREVIVMAWARGLSRVCLD
jgi:hypothetical protein